MVALAQRLTRLERRLAGLSIPGQDPQAEADRRLLLTDGIEFAKRFFKERTGSDMVVAPHHRAMQAALDAVLRGEITRLIINVPPGYTKTELAVINFMARGLAMSRSSKFIHISYSDELALLNSSTAKTIVNSQGFQEYWGVSLRNDAKSKSLWYTPEGGGVYAVSSKGQVTGFRAGHMRPGFSGAMSIDDPLKPADAFSETRRKEVNTIFSNTLKSRLMVETTPIVITMQRLHYDDPCGFLLRGGSGEKWHHLMLPVIIDNSQPYPAEYTHGIPIAHGLADGWLWPAKHSEEHRVALTSHRITWEAQYMQAPRKIGQIGALWNQAMITAARALGETLARTSRPERVVIGIDPAVSSGENSDETGIIVAARYPGQRGAILADYSGRCSPEMWAKKAIWAYEKHQGDAIAVEINQGGDMVEHTLRTCGYRGRVERIRARQGKMIRAEPISALYAQGQIGHVSDLFELEGQQMEYVPDAGAKSPDRLDAAVHALTELFPMHQRAIICGL